MGGGFSYAFNSFSFEVIKSRGFFSVKIFRFSLISLINELFELEFLRLSCYS